MSNYPHLMTPVRVGRQLLKNRIIVAPSTIHSASPGVTYPTEAEMSFYIDRARDGAGMVVCGGAKLLPVSDDGEHANWNLYQHNHLNRLAELADRIHFYGAKASMELIGIFDFGYVGYDGGLLMDGRTPGREIPVEEMMKYKEGYAHCAGTLMNLGFDAVLLHFGHSIPVAQFLSPLNTRKDQYGGSFENRMRYPTEILEAIRAKVGNNMLIDIRISADEFTEGGIDQEEGLKIAQHLQQYCDMIQASCGMIKPELMCRTHPCSFLPENPNVFLAGNWKKSGKLSIPVVTLGGIGSLEDAEEIIASGKADFVAVARSLIADPDLIHKSVAGRADDVVPCIKCMRCHDTAVYGHFFQCSVNPTIGLLHVIGKMVPPAGPSKKVAVVGGGPCGMKAALVAAERGHSVTLYEKTDSLGGALKFAGFVSFKYSLAKYKNYLIRQVEKSSVTVKLNTAATPEMLRLEGYDAVIAAVGAEPLTPPIPGLENAKAATSTYGHEDELGASVIVIGGGQVGCETALHLAQLGKRVSVVEMREALAPDASPTHRGELMDVIGKEANFVPVLNARCTGVTAKSVTAVQDGKEITIEADSVVLAAGMKPKTAEADSFIGTAPQFAEAGDCVKARTVEWATKDAYFAAVNL
ncbi:MAG: FAD-dependent oxidoreductase [Oscillospiraceae bacterium]|nr:FAD-dependent oxidoreductase [Oscillospiraceae bacterium]